MPRSFTVFIIAIGFIIVVAALFSVWQTLPKDRVLVDDTRVAALPKEPSMAVTDPVRGQINAPVTIVEYSDFECSHCADVESTLQFLLKKYPDKVRLVWKDMPDTAVHSQALGAHVAARCAQEQGKFWEYHDVIFARQLELAPANYSLWAKQLGLNTATFNLCFAQQRGKNLVQSDRIEGLQLGVNATPYFFIGRERLSGAVPLADFEKLLK